MVDERKFIDAPRLQVLLTPIRGKGADGPFDAWLVLHVPDGKPPETIAIKNGPYEPDAAVMLINEIYMEIGRRWAKPEALVGDQIPRAN